MGLAELGILINQNIKVFFIYYTYYTEGTYSIYMGTVFEDTLLFKHSW